MHLMYCKKCLEYTLKETCSKCGNKTSTPHPPRYSPKDRYGEYRRKLKLEAMGGKTK